MPSIDQFMQVKCIFQLVSESESSEAIHLNEERIRLCASRDLDKHSTLLVLVCFNETSNNHIVGYYIDSHSHHPIIKQIYYHNYNEDIVAIALNNDGTKLVLVNASSTIYLLPIKNILLDLHAQQLRSSQGKSMRFYDAVILNCCTITDPTVACLWTENSPPSSDQTQPTSLTFVVVANAKGKMSFISVDEKKELYKVSLADSIKSMKVVKDRNNVGLLIACESFNQYRLDMELVKLQHHYCYKPQKPQLTCKYKLHLSNSDELITHVVLTERFAAIATDRDRCLINSKKYCNLKRNSMISNIELDPLAKEILFGEEERIMLLIKSPVLNDQDNIIESFLLVTTRSIYSIQARQNCRDMFVNLIDTQLGIKQASKFDYCPPTRKLSFVPGGRTAEGSTHFGGGADLSLFKTNNFKPFDYCVDDFDARQRKNSQSNLLIDSFLCRREEIYERICHDSRAFSVLFRLDLNSLYEAYGDRCLLRNRFELANRFFQMAKFNHTKTLGKYIRLGAYQQTIEYISSVLHDDNEILDEKERIDLSKAAFECLLAKTVVERSKSKLFNMRKPSSRLAKLMSKLHDYRQLKRSLQSPKSSPNKHRCGSSGDGLPVNSNPCPIFLCEHCPRAQESKLSAATLVVEPTTGKANTITSAANDDEEATLTSTSNETTSGCANGDDTKPLFGAAPHRAAQPIRMECEKNLIDFIKHSMPTSLSNYVTTQLIAFNLIELVSCVVSSDSQVHSLLRILIRAKEEEQRMVFRDKRLGPFADKLNGLNLRELIETKLNKVEFLEFITSSEVTRALVKDISLFCEYLGYQHTHIQFRKYSFAALRHLETYLHLVRTRRKICNKDLEAEPSHKRADQSDAHEGGKQPFDGFDDENAHDGEMHFKVARGGHDTSEDCDKLILTKQEKASLERIFLQFLNACLRESTEDSCRLWSSYVEFYLNNMGSIDELESDILSLVDCDSCDLRLPLTLFRALHRTTAQPSRQKTAINTATFTSSDSSSDSIKQLRNIFLMKLLEKTLNHVPHTRDLDALIVMAMC